jgi:cytochrome c-type biogenesis protein CcsB
MITFIKEMLASLQSGAVADAAIGFFDLSFILFIISTICYLTFLLRRKNGIWLVGFSSLCVGIATMTTALILRWIAAGWEHPPWSNLYESLVFFSWGLIVSYVVVELRYRVKVAGAFIVPIVMIAMGIASLSGNKDITPLMPALQSLWLHFHVFSAAIGYAMFIVAFGFAVLYLFRDQLPMPWFHAAAATFNVLAFIAVTRGQVFLMRFPLIKGVVQGGHVFKSRVPETAPVQFHEVEIQGMGLFMFIIMALFVASGVVSFLAAKNGEEKSKRNSFFAFLLPVILFFLALAQLSAKSGDLPGFFLSLNIYSFALLAFSWFFSVVSLMLHVGGESLREHLPEAKILDKLTYKSIMVAFPILFFVIVSGAIWANEAWGRYWGWDPKETASLVTWIVYLIYLHTRITKGWMGRPTAYIAIIGFASVVFTYLGVNLVISGLHSYATG